MVHKLKKASYLNIVANIFLFFLNLVVGFGFGALSFISKAVESIHDILTAIIIHFTIKINNMKPDDKHQFGHTRAENLAGYTIGIFMILLSFKLFEVSFKKILNPEVIAYSNIMFYVIFIAFFVKGFLYFYVKDTLKEHKSAALKANMQDHLNDLFMYAGIFIAIIAIKYGYYLVDPIVGFIIGILVLKSGYDIARENVNYLMGISANDDLTNRIKNIALSINGILGTNTIKTQYLGSRVQAEIHIELDSKLSLKKSHDIGKEVKFAIEKLRDIEDCFVHIDVHKK